MPGRTKLLRRLLTPRSSSRLRGSLPEFSGETIANPSRKRRQNFQSTPKSSKNRRVDETTETQCTTEAASGSQSSGNTEPQPSTSAFGNIRDLAEYDTTTSESEEEDFFNTGKLDLGSSLLEEIVDVSIHEYNTAPSVAERRRYSQHLRDQTVELVNNLSRQYNIPEIVTEGASREVSVIEPNHNATFREIIDDTRQTILNLTKRASNWDVNLTASTPSKIGNAIDIQGESPAQIGTSNHLVDLRQREDRAGGVIMASADSLMPKFHQTLTRTNLENFINELKFWARSKGVTDEKILKTTLPLVIQNNLARQYLSIRKDELVDDSVSFDGFAKEFINSCPMEADEEYDSIIQVLSLKQPYNEKASHFVQKIRFLFGNRWEKSEEEEYVKLMVNNLDSAVKRYILCKGMPRKYDRLMEYIKEYEAGDQAVTKSNQVQGNSVGYFKQEPSQSDANTLLLKSMVESSLKNDSQQKLEMHLKQISEGIERLNVGNQQVSRQNFNGRRFNQMPNRNFRNVPRCFNCNKTGHIAINCWQKTPQNNGRPQRNASTQNQNFRGGYRPGNSNNSFRQNNQGQSNNQGFAFNRRAQEFTPKSNMPLNA